MLFLEMSQWIERFCSRVNQILFKLLFLTKRLKKVQCFKHNNGNKKITRIIHCISFCLNVSPEFSKLFFFAKQTPGVAIRFRTGKFRVPYISSPYCNRNYSGISVTWKCVFPWSKPDRVQMSLLMYYDLQKKRADNYIVVTFFERHRN